MAQTDTNGQSSFTTSSIAGSKRKREALRFYAVRVGRRPGIYDNWNECLAEVQGFKGATYKSFSTKSDAEGFIAAKDLATAGSIGKVKKWYGVQVGRTSGVYTTWLAVQDQISGFKGAQYKSFPTKAEAGAYVMSAGMELSEELSVKKGKTTKAKGKANGAPQPIVDLADYTPGEAPLPEETEDGFDTSVILDEETGEARYRTREERSKLKMQAARPTQDSPIAIYTDGSALANGTNGAMGGVGVYFGRGDKRNISEGLAGSRQTNNRAELTAVLRALEMAPRDRKLVIHSDSNYAINCVTKWYISWRKNGWTNAAGKPVENKDLIMKTIDLLDERMRLNRNRQYDSRRDESNAGPWANGIAGVKFVWVKGHTTDEGNIAADNLATSGAREARQLHEDIDV